PARRACRPSRPPPVRRAPPRAACAAAPPRRWARDRCCPCTPSAPCAAESLSAPGRRHVIADRGAEGLLAQQRQLVAHPGRLLELEVAGVLEHLPLEQF